MTAAGRVFAVLDVFRAGGTLHSMAEISRRSGLSLTTTHRLVHELMDWGGVERTSDGAFRLGTGILDLATSSGQAMHLRERALPALLRLHRMLRVLVVHLAIRDGFDGVYVESLRSAHGIVGENRIGGRLPLHLTSTGRVLLAHAPEDVQTAYLARPLESRTRYTLTDPVELRAALATIREQRIGFTERQITRNTGGVSAPVVDGEGRVVAAVGIVLPVPEHRLEDYVDLVTAAAAQVSRALERE